MSASVSRSLSSAGLLHAPWLDAPRRLTVAWSAAADDPLAVTLHLSRPGEEVAWVFARQLLDTGRSQRTGVGLVAVAPAARAGFLRVDLRSVDGPVSVIVRRDPVDEFLVRTAGLAAPERFDILFDAAAARLLARR